MGWVRFGAGFRESSGVLGFVSQAREANKGVWGGFFFPPTTEHCRPALCFPGLTLLFSVAGGIFPPSQSSLPILELSSNGQVSQRAPGKYQPLEELVSSFRLE